MPAVRRRVSSAHLLSIIAIVLATCVPAGAAGALITAKQIGNNAVLSRHIKNGQLGSSDLAPRAVKGNNLAPGSVGTVQVADGSITASDLAPGTIPVAGPTVVTGSMLATGSVTESTIAAGAVSTRTLADGAVTSGKLASGAVTSTQLADGSVTAAKLATGSVTGGALGSVVGAGVSATAVAVPNDVLDTMPAEEADGYVVPFDTELFDTASMWGSGSPTELVVPTDGLYEVEAWVSWEAGSGYREAQLLQDGTIFAQDRGITGTSMGNRLNQTLAGVVDAQAGDVLTLRISHQAGSTLNADRIRVTVHRLGTSS